MDIDPEILRKYWNNACSAEERQLVEQWLAAGEPPTDYSVGDDLEKERLRQEIWAPFSGKTDPLPGQPITRHNTRFLFPVIAASVIFAVLAGYLFWGRPGTENEIPVSQYKEIRVPYGRKMTVKLPDSTVLSLNAGSSLRYPGRFSNNRRHVILDGEAFFEVAKHPERPFIVETSHSSTRVLGTRFNLRDFEGDGNSSIVVEEGKVAFTGSGSRDTLILVADDRATFANGAMRQNKVNPALYSDWKENVLRFPDIPLSEAVPMIERWYNVQIKLSDPSLAKLKIKGDFRDVSLKALMDDFSYLMNLRYKLEGRNLILYKS